MMQIEDFTERLRFSRNYHEPEIRQKLAVADAELARVGINVNATDETLVSLLDYARELFLKAEFNFDGRGERYAAQFEAVRDAMKLSSAYTAQSAATGGGGGE